MLKTNKYKITIGDESFIIKLLTINVINNDVIKINRSVKTSLKRKYNIDFYDLITKYFKVEKCRICNIEYAPIFFTYTIDNNTITINGIKYTKYIYCYRKNKSCEGGKLNPNSVVFISKILNMSSDEALSYIKSRNSSPFYIENHNSKDDYLKYQTRDLDFFMLKYGEEKGNIKYNEWKKTLSYKQSKQSYIDLYGEEKGNKIFNDLSKKKDSSSFKYFLKKYNNEETALHFFNDKNNKCKQTLDNFINKHGNVVGEEKYNEYLSVLKSINTLEFYIKKYGEEKGNELYKKLRHKVTSANTNVAYLNNHSFEKAEEIMLGRIKNISANTVSKESTIFFDKLTLCLLKTFPDHISINDVMYGEDQLEFNIFDSNTSSHKFYDFFIKKYNIIIEYNGIAFHPRKDKLSSHEWNNWENVFTHKKADEMYQLQEYKLELAKTHNYNILEIWNDDSISDNIKKCINFIKNNF